MPAKNFKLGQEYEAAMDKATQWKRTWFAQVDFGSCDELVRDASMGGQSKVYVSAYLNLAHYARKRRTVQELASAMGSAVRGHARPHWLAAVESGLWLHYQTERFAWKSLQGKDEDPAYYAATQEQRASLLGSGRVTKRRVPPAVRAQKSRDRVLGRCAGSVFVCWIDNYNKFRYSRNPNEDRDLCINATVAALLPQPLVFRPAWTGWLAQKQLMDAMRLLPGEICLHQRVFQDDFRVMLRRGLTWGMVRVPCDLRRYGVRTLPWTPFGLLDADIKGTAGLVEALRWTMDVQASTSGLCCLLMDVNIFWRTCRMVYGATHLKANLIGGLHECPPIMGLWHAYAHCLKKVHQRFLAWMAPLTLPGFLDFPADTPVYLKPKIITLEVVMMGLFLISQQMSAQLRRWREEAAIRFGVDSERAQQAAGLELLVTEYAPAVVTMGIHVRQMFWGLQNVDTGAAARDVLRHAICLLINLEATWKTEYVRNLMVMDIMWSKFHDRLPAAAFVEECLESSLSTLARRKQCDPTAKTVAQFSDMYGAIGPRSLVSRNNLRSGISKLFPARLKIRIVAMADLILALPSLGLPGVVMGPEVKTKGSRTWDAFPVPQRLVRNIDKAEWTRMYAHALHVLLDDSKGIKADKVDADAACMETLKPKVRPVPDGYLSATQAESVAIRAELHRMKSAQPKKRKAVKQVVKKPVQRLPRKQPTGFIQIKKSYPIRIG
jgi:hypothetical protein